MHVLDNVANAVDPSGVTLQNSWLPAVPARNTSFRCHDMLYSYISAVVTVPAGYMQASLRPIWYSGAHARQY